MVGQGYIIVLYKNRKVSANLFNKIQMKTVWLYHFSLYKYLKIIH